MKMLHVTVKKAFMDSRTGLKRKPGDMIIITEERYRVIKRSGDYVEVTATAEKAAKTTKPTATAEKAENK